MPCPANFLGLGQPRAFEPSLDYNARCMVKGTPRMFAGRSMLCPYESPNLDRLLIRASIMLAIVRNLSSSTQLML